VSHRLGFSVLGPFEVVRDGRPVGPAGPKRRGLLAMLVLRANMAVPTAELIDGLWAGRPPASAANLVQTYVSAWRKVLEPDRNGRGGGTRLTTVGPAYRLRVEPGELDLDLFTQAVADGTAAADAGHHRVAASKLDGALDLWRGLPLADLAGLAFHGASTARLAEARLQAVEVWAAAALQSGDVRQVLAVVAHERDTEPMRERLSELLMWALLQDGRQAEALAVFEQTRRLLADELGADPGAGLQDMHSRVLRQDQALRPAAQLPTNLPAQVSSFVGRESEVARVCHLITSSRLVTLTGAGGAGKTRLAQECSAIALERFADGVWLADLGGIGDPDLVPSRVMESIGVRQSGDLPVIEALRYRLRSAELMLIFDNCEHLLDACAQLAGELLQGSPRLHVLATSREPLGVAGEVVYPVPPLGLPAETADEQASANSPAVRLFLDRASAARGGDAGPMPLTVVARICRELDGLPLAIELAAARGSALSVDEIAEHLADKLRFLRFRRPTAIERHQTLPAAIGWSYELLSEQERRFFRQLSVFAGGFGLEPVAVVCCGGDQVEALDMVDRLVSKSLVAAEPIAAGTRYRLLGTIREYAAGLLAEAGEADASRTQHAEVFLRLAERERDDAVLAREQDNLRAALDWSLSRQTDTAPRLASALGAFWLARGLLEEGTAWLEGALGHGGADARLRACLLRQLGILLARAGDLRKAAARLTEGSQVAETAGLPAERARIVVHMADLDYSRSGRDALTECEAAAAILESEGDLEGLAEAWLSIGKLRFFLGDCYAGAEALEHAAARARRCSSHQIELEATRWLVICWWMLCIPASEAIDRTEQILQAVMGDDWAEAAILEPLSLLYAHAGRFADARSAIARARTEYARSGAKFDWAHCAIPAGHIELIAADSASAERILSEGCEAFREMGERGFFASAAAMLAEALYVQGRIKEARTLTEEAESCAADDDIDAQARLRATGAKILARTGQMAAARRLADEAVAQTSLTSYTWLLAETLTAQAEVARLAGAYDDAAASLRRALALYQDSRATALAKRVTEALARLPV
jgi:predicted ATPase/DNA-binding SARP family transcriptional activator